MQALMERLSWIKLGVSGELLELAAIGVAIDEANCSIAIAEVIGMKSLIGRLEFIRNYLAGEHSDKKAAMDRMIECLAIAEAMPEITIAVAPACLCPDGGRGNWFDPACLYHCDIGQRLSQPPARERVRLHCERDGSILGGMSSDGLTHETNITPDVIRAGVRAFFAWDTDAEEPESLVVSVFLSMIDALHQVVRTGETIKIENPDDPSQFIYIQKLGVRLAEPPAGEDAPEPRGFD
jgi:hypothetical protein